MLHYLLEDWRTLLPAPWADIALAFAAVVCGAIVGGEREKREKAAGLRTLVLVCLGAAVFTMVSYAFTSTTGDSGRVAAQIVTGIGFLGAGVILHARGTVTGMTTAASVWVTAAIGMTVGTGHVGAGLGLSVLVRAALAGILLSEQRSFGELPAVIVELLVDPNHGKTRLHLEKILEDFQPGHLGVQWAEGPDGLLRVRLDIRLPRKHRCDLLDELASLPEVREIHQPARASVPANPNPQP